MSRRIFAALAVLAALAMAQVAVAEPLIVPFDFSRGAIGMQVKVRGVPLYMLLDTGVDPSLIDLRRAVALGLKVDRKDGGEASGFGDGPGALIFPTHIDRFVLGGRAFASFEALASGMTAMSVRYGKKIDGIVGFSFLSSKIVLIDYPKHQLGILHTPVEADGMTKTCRQHWQTPMHSVDNFPVISNFRLGANTVPISLDTGSNGGVAFFKSALHLPGISEALKEQGTITHTGARGAATLPSYLFDAPVGVGPFTLPPGQKVSVHSDVNTKDERAANIGNSVFAAMQLKIMLDYPGKTITVFGDCR